MLTAKLQARLKTGVLIQTLNAYRWGRRVIEDKLFSDMLKGLEIPEGGRLVWVAGMATAYRLHNRPILGTPKDFVHTAKGWDMVIGHIHHTPVWASGNPARWPSDTLVLLVIDADDQIVDDRTSFIDTDSQQY